MPELPAPRGIDLVAYEPEDEPNEIGVIKPYRVSINGTEVLTPENSPIVITGLVDKTVPLQATMTVFVRSLKVHGSKSTEPKATAGTTNNITVNNVRAAEQDLARAVAEGQRLAQRFVSGLAGARPELPNAARHPRPSFWRRLWRAILDR